MKRMEHQIVVRVDSALLSALRADADENGRTLAQSVRFLLRRSVAPASPDSVKETQQP